MCREDGEERGRSSEVAPGGIRTTERYGIARWTAVIRRRTGRPPGQIQRETMCLILLALDTHPDYSLVVAANRDEFYDRPTARAAFWEDDAVRCSRAGTSRPEGPGSGSIEEDGSPR